MTSSGGDDGDDGGGAAQAAALREREALMAEAEAIARVGSYLWQPGSTPVWSDGMFRVLGYLPGQVEPGADAFFSRVHPDDLERVRSAHVRMPSMGGLELAHVVRRLRPTLPVLLMSGFSELPEGARALTVLDKPIAADRLIAEVRKHME